MITTKRIKDTVKRLLIFIFTSLLFAQISANSEVIPREETLPVERTIDVDTFNLTNVEKENKISQYMIDICEQDDDCIIVEHAHCCGSTKKAINKKYLKAYNEHPQWKSFFDETACSLIGVCPDDTHITEARCKQSDENSKRCQLFYN